MEEGLTELESAVYQIMLSCGLKGIGAEEIQKMLKIHGRECTVLQVRETTRSLK
ncbi:MAG: hypothetical protein RLY61_627 [Candidatus Parcubacteria bacterium]|jgi:hypothetical protein